MTHLSDIHSMFGGEYCFLWRQNSHRSCNFMLYSIHVYKQTFWHYLLGNIKQCYLCTSFVEYCVFGMEDVSRIFLCCIIIPYAISSVASTHPNCSTRQASQVWLCMAICKFIYKYVTHQRSTTYGRLNVDCCLDIWGSRFKTDRRSNKLYK